MFSKILIANRGEIACRIIRTCRELGIATVAVYSEADAGALHVEQADEAVYLGPPPAAESYLLADKIIAAARATGADAVHPGFGFLAENAGFAEALEAAGIVFIGPGPKAIAAMGDKIESKKLAGKANINTVPGYVGEIADVKQALKIAREIGYPVMVKASAGGGGKGMRVARDDGEVAEGFESAANEARSSFGDDRLFIEKFIEQPRHIEIQVLADAHGNCIHLGERECSIQRRHQKVIEEAPSPFVDAEMRAAMGAQAVALAQAVYYRSAGTVEFIVDTKKNFYFLEMNTRLQVEHPVTEMITGIDLVAEMIRVAAGAPLSLGQDEVRFDGWALECRIYAEDPLRNFMPSIGRLVRCQPPEADAGVRVDTGVGEGSEITMFYDPMIAKLVTHGRDRDEATTKMRDALDNYYLRGINHNVAFLAAIMANERFRQGALSTDFIETEFPDGFTGAPLTAATRDILIASAVLLHGRRQAQERSISGQLAGRSPVLASEWTVSLSDDDHDVESTGVEGGVDVEIDGRIVAARGNWSPGQPLFRGTADSAPVTVQVDRQRDGYVLTHAGITAFTTVRSRRAAVLARLMPVKPPPDLSKFLLCPMPGLVVAVNVAAGEEVKAGQPLAVVEAMKMENVLRAERDGIVAAVRAAPGESLSVDAVILEFE